MKGYAERLADWAARLGATVHATRYPRVEARGEACAVRLVPPGAPTARVLVAHGAGNDALFPLLELFGALLASGAEVFSFDVDGHGCASTTVFAPGSVRTAIAAAADQAERGRPPLPLHVVGHSLGGSLMLDALASGSLQRAASAAILSSPVDVRIGARTVAGELRGFFRLDTLAQRRHYGWWGLVPAFGPVKRASYPFRRVDDDGRAWSYVAAVQRLLAELDLEARAGTITHPTLLVYSDGDWIVPHAQGARLAARIPGAELLSLRGVSHYTLPFHRLTIERVVRWIGQHQLAAA
ncbi:alpha/beta hydrolase [Longimicrobium sp.]|jgi:alpha-beta hydrolase superfamily lysophospholipase|uniref:alpha/beta hydrolase n=1 Tax=Longimicrobium sp. TaxID=2029185 RepID=UPI002EDB3527